MLFAPLASPCSRRWRPRPADADRAAELARRYGRDGLLAPQDRGVIERRRDG